LALVSDNIGSHFDLWKEDGMLLYRHGHCLQAPSHAGQCEALLRASSQALLQAFNSSMGSQDG
jgi:hypothetical protein